ncbi:hypothetical protein [uncultured Alistipes sp.]|uniref:hypothetical protein n=1 Tax=uncultured Alistipes sp. TaxID=538949 RepID=UPI001F9D17DC|nr:hypothetical protein [uncultured Alistipes sp.]HJC16778.1 hypothetical protein [Candidatus Alistipes stercorigallinarum]
MNARIRSTIRRTLLAATVLLLLGCLFTGERPGVKLWLSVGLLLATHLLSLRESLRSAQSEEGAEQSAGTPAGAPAAGQASAGMQRRDESARPSWRRSLTAPQITGLLLFVVSVNEALACVRLMARGGEASLPLALAVLLSAGGLWYLVSHGKQA